MQARLLLAVVAMTSVVPPAVGAPTVPVVVIDGRGHGHGVGMAQDGAYWMGRAGATTTQILGQFYPGTTSRKAGGEVRVAVLATAARSVVIGFPGGGEVRDARQGRQSAGFPVRVRPGGQARIKFDGRQYTVEVPGGARAAPAASGGPDGGTPAAPAAKLMPAQQPTTTTTTPLDLLPGGDDVIVPPPTTPEAPAPTVPPPTTTTAVPTTGPAGSATERPATTNALWAVPTGDGTVHVPERAHRYRGAIQVVGGGGSLRLVNHVDVEQYLRGMGEVRNPSWPPAALRAQAVAARTYALRAVSGGGELCDTQQCQVYLGAEAEYAAMDKAVAATRGQVLSFRGALASAVYSANGGGFSASTEEGFGTPGQGYPYLRPTKYPTSDPLPWSLTVALRSVAARVGYRGQVSGLRAVSTGPSGRVLQVAIEGSGGVRTVSGIEFDRALGLKSTMFTLRLGETATPPPPPPPPDSGPLQRLPDEPASAATSPPGAVEAGGAGAGRATDAAGVLPVPAASNTPRVVLGSLAWLLLASVAGAAAALRCGASSAATRRLSPPPS